MRTKSEIQQSINNNEINWLGRDGFIKDFVKHILNQRSSKHICINGVWGSGKTTTIFGIINEIKNGHDDVPLVLYFDVWKYEHYEEPVFALLKIIREENTDLYYDI